MPVLVDESGLLIAGHCRTLAAQRLGLPEIPTVVARGWTDAQIRAYRIADNKLTVNGDWDVDTLTGELSALLEMGSNLEMIGFSQTELAALLAPDTAPDDEWQGMPDFDQPKAGAFRSVIVHFNDQAGVDKFARLLNCPVGPKTKFVWYPRAPDQPYQPPTSPDVQPDAD